jgi:23S rRNA-/tRNA-specific pseudouridylate synthase
MNARREPPGELVVLYRDERFLVVDKPAFLATTSPSGGETVVARARALDPRAPAMHPSSRLDAEVTGVLVFARSREAILHLLAARREHRYQRGYVGIAAAAPDPREGEWQGAIAIDVRDPRRRSVASAGARGARPSCTRYRTLAAPPRAALLWLEPQTGRTHQLRVHAAHAGCALLGDRPYSGAARLVLEDGSVIAPRRAMLHCARVTIPDPQGGAPLRFEATPPADLQKLWAQLGGDAIALPP